MILANAESIHTKKWVVSLSEKGIDIVLFSLHAFNTSSYSDLHNFSYYNLEYNNSLNKQEAKFKKIYYLKAVSKIKNIISIEKPDILHAHYASSYGLLGALCKFHPYIISVWGSDIYEFPRSSIIAKTLVKYSLSKADLVLSTSNVMAKETRKYCKKQIEVTPFGIDLSVFYNHPHQNLFEENSIVIGTIKTLEKIYGLEYLIDAFAIVAKKLPEHKTKLLIVGSGSCEIELKDRVKKWGIQDRVLFTGFIDHSLLPKYYNNIHIFVVSSLNESFGVSVLEASACEIPVIVTNTGGLPEIVENNITGLVVPVQNADEIAKAIEKLLLNEKLRVAIGKNGRKRVETFYNWVNNVLLMIQIYNELISKK